MLFFETVEIDTWIEKYVLVLFYQNSSDLESQRKVNAIAVYFYVLFTVSILCFMFTFLRKKGFNIWPCIGLQFIGKS